ncbi:PPC domain-containing DNA-binding protein [Spirosoma pomorum]
MKISCIKLGAIAALLIAGISFSAQAQEYVSPTKPAQTGRSPGVKVKLLSTSGNVKTYAVIFSTGDEVVSGLTEFAQKYDVKSAHYTAIGDAKSAKVGWYDYGRKQFKVIPIGEAEVTSMVGDIAVFNGKPVAHTHLNLATEDGISHGGHLLELLVGPTLEVFVTVEPTPLYKRLNPEFDAAVIDPSLNK